MSWLGLADHQERRFSLRGIGDDRSQTRRHPAQDDYLLSRGSLVFETRMKPDRRPHVLLSFTKDWPNRRSLSFQAIPGGGISFVQVEGDKISHGALQHPVSARTDSLRVTFSWDARHQKARLTAERPETCRFTSTVINGISPVLLSDLRDFIMGRGTQTLDADIIYAALSDKVEPVGPTPSLSAEAMIETPWGYCAAAGLRRGDTVITRDGDVVPILHRIDRTVPARGSFAPVRLRAPYFGLLEDAVVAPEQRLVIGGSEVEYLFNEEAVLVPARHLMNGFAARREPPRPTVCYTQLILPAHEAVKLAGTSAESLYIGRLRRKPGELDATLLRHIDRTSLPEHGRAAFKELQWYDAIHLARQRAA